MDKEKFFRDCYKEGAEWAENTRKQSPHISLETGSNKSFWSGPEQVDDYVAVFEVGHDHGINTVKDVQSRREGLAQLYRGCTERWVELFGNTVKHFEKEQVVEAVKSRPAEPFVPSEPHKVSKPLSMAQAASLHPNKLTSFGPRKIFGKGAIKYIFPDNTSLVKRNGQDDFISSCKNMMCFCDLSSPCQKS